MEIRDQIYEITDCATGDRVRFEPIASESCMNPGTLRITPFFVEETEDTITLRSTEKTLTLTKKELRDGKKQIHKVPFLAKLPAKTQRNGCTPCTNCGHCSW